MGEWVVVGLLVVIAAGAVAAVATVQLTRARQKVEVAWDQLALAMRRRHHLAEELADASAVRGLRTDVAERVGEARTVADLPGASSPYEQEAAELELDSALNELTELIDQDPSIATDPHVASVRVMLDDSRLRIEARRRDYDVSARMLTGTAGRWPGRWMAASLGLARRPGHARQ